MSNRVAWMRRALLCGAAVAALLFLEGDASNGSAVAMCLAVALWASDSRLRLEQRVKQLEEARGRDRLAVKGMETLAKVTIGEMEKLSRSVDKVRKQGHGLHVVRGDD